MPWEVFFDFIINKPVSPIAPFGSQFSSTLYFATNGNKQVRIDCLHITAKL